MTAWRLLDSLYRLHAILFALIWTAQDTLLKTWSMHITAGWFIVLEWVLLLPIQQSVLARVHNVLLVLTLSGQLYPCPIMASSTSNQPINNFYNVFAYTSCSPYHSSQNLWCLYTIPVRNVLQLITVDTYPPCHMPPGRKHDQNSAKQSVKISK